MRRLKAAVDELATRPLPHGNAWMGSNTEAEWSNVPILAWRSWEMRSGLGVAGYVPTGNYGVRWLSTTHPAVCDKQQRSEVLAKLPIPHSNQACNECGVYASKKVVNTLNGVFGVVALTGRILEGSKGYRAEKAEVIAAVAWKDGKWYWVEDWVAMIEPRKAMADDALDALRYSMAQFASDPLAQRDPTADPIPRTVTNVGLGAEVLPSRGMNDIVERAGREMWSRGYFETGNEAEDYAMKSLRPEYQHGLIGKEKR